MSTKGTNKLLAVIGAIGVAAAVGAGAAWAQQLNPGISCLDGEVAGSDYAEFTSKYRESIWDNKAAVRLVAEDAPLELLVTDLYGNSVCEETADMKTRCKFRLASDYAGTFVMRIDNLVYAGNSRYRLCAE